MKDSEKIEKIYIKVVRIEEHIKNQNSRVEKNEDKIDSNHIKIEKKIEKIQRIIPSIALWDKLKTIAILLLSGLCGSMGTYIFLT